MTNLTHFSRKVRATLGALAATATLSSASVSLNYQFISPELPAGTRCVLVASTQDNSFGQPGDLAGLSLTEGATFGTDNVVVAVLTAEDLPGALTGAAGMLSLNYEGGLNEGDPLRLIWLPGLPSNANMIPLGSGYREYDSALPADGGTIGYELPADGATDSLYSIGSQHGGATTFPGALDTVVATYPHGQDSDGDQMDDLLEFALGLDVNRSSTAQEPVLTLDGGQLRYEFSLREDLNEHGLSLVVETSRTLRDDSWTQVATQASTAEGFWHALVNAPIGENARQFFRFRIETTAP